MGTANVAFKVPADDKPFELIVSTYQMCILYMFNLKKEITMDEIKEQMGFD